MKGYRWIHVKGNDYRWKVGKNHVVIRPQEGPCLCPTIAQLLYMTNDEVERGMWKGWLSITPADIKEYILKEPTHER